MNLPILQSTLDYRKSYSVGSKAEVLAQYTVEEILPLIVRGNAPTYLNTRLGDLKVKTFTAKLQSFKENLACVWCGIVGNVFLLEKRDSHNAILNLYSYVPHSHFVEMTVDHIIPHTAGHLLGKQKYNDICNDTTNHCTMCCIHNHSKGELLPLQFVLKEIDWSTWRMFEQNKHRFSHMKRGAQ